MAVKLKKRKTKNADGSTSLYLDIWHDGKRSYEFLTHLKLSKVSSPLDRQKNKENFQLAKKIEIKRAQDLASGTYDMASETGKKTLVAEWMQSYINKYKKKDVRNMQGALNRFKDFLIEEKLQGLTFGKLTEVIISDFQDYLKTKSEGEGAASYFNRFKKMVKQAFRQKLILSNPAAEVKTKQGKARKKDFLTLDEIKLLASKPCESEYVKKGFLFSCMTGLRWCDVKTLTWDQIDLKEKTLSKPQDKTDEDLAINLNETAIKLLPSANGSEFVFDLPTANGANKTVKAWVKRAGIQKKITWHNARHSYGTNLVFYGTDLLTTSKLMGHTTTKHTERYAKIVKELKERATDKLNIEL